ncbi:DNA methyltransferase [Micromonospora chersina]|uniref:DNA methyltransferase n=1 Tax=Micromonospora chersina TaxID=47854 RepID=UPI0033E2C988
MDDVRSVFRDGFTSWERAWTSWAQSGRSQDARGRYFRERDAWVHTVVTDVLEWGDYYRSGSSGIRAASLDGQVAVEPAGALVTGERPEALLLVVDPTEDLAAPGTDGWTASAIDRGAALLRGANEQATTNVPVALVTDGRWWSLVWTSDQGSVGSGTFDGALFREEPDLRDAFWALARLTSLAGGAVERRLPALLRASVASAEEITDALGRQARSAVELLVQSFSESHVRALAGGGASPLPDDGHEVYEAAVTVMMRVVFLLFAEANELLPDGALFHQAYAISGVGEHLDERRRHAVGAEGEELLEGSYDSWHRLLATSRALFEGATFEDLRMPAYGGSLFDPQRFDWLMATDPSTGRLRVLVDDRIMLHVLRAVQHVEVDGEDRTVSFRELDVEQIGYVYEGLLGYSARFTDSDEIIVGLQGPEQGSEPEVPLMVLHDLADQAGDDGRAFAKLLLDWLKRQQPGAKPRTALQIAKAYELSGTREAQDDARRLLRPVVREKALVEELVGYIELIRRDLRGLPYVTLAGGLVVVETPSRATSGTHYTPRSLAEEVVHHALDPLVYSPGPLQTAETAQWVPISSSKILNLKVADIAVGSGAFLVAAARYLGRKLLEAWDREGITRQDVTAEQRRRREIEARREVIAHCLYGADINSMAVEMCKLSLWLVSLDPAQPFSFVDDKIFCGNSLLGLTEVRQLRGLHINPKPARINNPGFTVDVDVMLQRATELRHQLASTVSEADTMRSTRAKRALMKQLDDNNRVLRDVADGIIATGLTYGGKPGKALDNAYERLSYALMHALPGGEGGDRTMLDGIIDRGLTPTVQTDWGRWKPLHWVIEAPDVIVEHGGFDAVIGNPPFLGGPAPTRAFGTNFREWLRFQVGGGTPGAADLAAYFLLRAVALLFDRAATVGMISTNSISDGDTREAGLDQILSHNFHIFRSDKSAKWPTANAKVTIAKLWLSKAAPEVCWCDGVRVTSITASLEPPGRTIGSPLRLVENGGICFKGSNVYGEGFILSDSERSEIIAKDPSSAQVIFPFPEGKRDVCGSSNQRASRWVICFGNVSREQAAKYPAAFARVEALVKPQRATNGRRARREKWWVFGDYAAGLQRAIRELNQVLVIVLHSRTVMPARLPAGQIFGHGLGVFATDDYADQAVLSSSMHQTWAIKYGSGIRNDPRYTPSDVFETFPRPRSSEELRAIGRTLDDKRREIMLRRNLSLTEVYNLVNSPDVQGDADVQTLRDIHVALDEAVVRAYGWNDVSLDHGFHTYRQMERFTFSPAARVELLDRLLEENHGRAALQAHANTVGDDDDDVHGGGEDQ